MGEISAIAASILLTKDGFDNYVVTDDNVARKSIERLSSDTMFWNTVGLGPVEIKYAGTVGIILKLKSHDMVDPSECKLISIELRDSSFRVPDYLLRLLCD